MNLSNELPYYEQEEPKFYEVVLLCLYLSIAYPLYKIKEGILKR